ncbi:interleukin-17C-like isoform X2 [Cottoperca gobio]|nr:interleukin-17C-like isoform X2 [Cottoperca gobio]
MISLGSLLFFNDHTSAAAAYRSSRCISVDQVNDTVDRFERSFRGKPRLSKNLHDTRTCAQVAAEMRGELSNRSLSPWKYNLTQDPNRYPYEIPIAVCLCQGCIINQREDLSYNSVPVFTHVKVLMKTLCPQNKTSEDKYTVKKYFIEVAVACTCAVPKYAK